MEKKSGCLVSGTSRSAVWSLILIGGSVKDAELFNSGLRRKAAGRLPDRAGPYKKRLRKRTTTAPVQEDSMSKKTYDDFVPRERGESESEYQRGVTAGAYLLLEALARTIADLGSGPSPAIPGPSQKFLSDLRSKLDLCLLAAEERHPEWARSLRRHASGAMETVIWSADEAASDSLSLPPEPP